MHWSSVAWGLSHISSIELTEWMAYYSLEPLGDERLDYLVALLSSVTANVHLPSDKQLPIGYFMPEFNKPKIQQTETSNSIFETAKMICNFYNQ